MEATRRALTLADGTRLVIRRSTLDDRAGLAALFEAMSSEDRHRRFFSEYHPDERFLRRIAGANEAGACQVVATVARPGRPPELIAEAGAWPLPNGNAELGITVLARWRGWLGPYLLDVLCDEAAARGIPNLEADVLATNSPMLAVLRSRGIAFVPQDEPTLVRVTIATTGRVPAWAPNDERPRVLVESGSTRSREAKELVAGGYQVLLCPGPTARPHGSCPALAGVACPLAAAADGVLVELTSDEVRAAVAAAHGEVHAGVPVCVRAPGAADAATATVALLSRW